MTPSLTSVVAGVSVIPVTVGANAFTLEKLFACDTIAERKVSATKLISLFISF